MAAAATAQEASSSMPRCTYHVFLSFRGEDTRTNFTSHLYTALVQAGFHTFLDDDGIERGEDIRAELKKAIEESKISIIVLSKDYASSRWCLDELVMIMERRRTTGLIVVPVFYDVDPSQLRNLTGSFAEAFARHEKRFQDEMDKVKRWRAALRETANLGGMVLGDRHESQFVQNIVQEIGNKLKLTILNVESNLVGLNSRVRDINLWVQDGSNDVGIAMIYGIGGIGKTTIAKTIFNLNFDRFEGRSFLGNVRETTKQLDGLVRLQRKLLTDILKKKPCNIFNADEGIIKIKHAICHIKILLVLDDVDQLEQLNLIIGMRAWFWLGSKIIITTRHERLEGFNEVCEKFKVKQLDDDESFQLFSLHAFKQGHLTEGYMEWARKAAQHCGGLPLALRVLGSALNNRDKTFWESALQKLEEIPLVLQVCDSKIQNILRISYDALQDDCRDLFLNIACFFIGKDKDYIVKILDRHDSCITIGIQNLIDRCLLTINEAKKLMMHQLLRDMGREIVRRESINDLGKRSRLWLNKDAFTVLKDLTGTEIVKGLTLDLHRLMEDKRGKTIANINHLKRHHDQDYLDNSTIGICSKRRRLGFFSWQPMDIASNVHFPCQVDLETKTFKKMHNLELLQLNYVKLRGDYIDFSKNLRWLCWHGFPLKSIPTNCYLEKLVALDMRYSSLRHVWSGTKFLAELKFLNLSHSHGLLRTPDFSGLPNLERLVFKDCKNLVEVDESIADLKRLVFLNLKDCKKIWKLPREITMLKSLEELNLSGCSKLVELPEELKKMESLKVLYLDGTPTNQLLCTPGDRKRLSLSSPTFWHSAFWSWLSPRKSQCSTSFSLASLPQSLVKLSLVNSNLSDDAISYGLAHFPSLQELNLSGNPFHNLPESIRSLATLKYLDLRDCTGIQSLPEFPSSLARFYTHGCMSLERIPNGLLSLKHWDIAGCEKLVDFRGFFKLEPIKNTDIAVINSMGLSNLEDLESVEVDLCSSTIGYQRKFPLQVLHECGIRSVFLPGSEVPNCFNLKKMGSLISLHVPPLVDRKIRSFNLCTLYAFDPESDVEYNEDNSHYARIYNKSKGMRWTYEPHFFAYQGAKEGDMLWISNWNFGYDEIEGEDEIDVSVVFPPPLLVKMCGIRFIYESEDEGAQLNIEESVLSAFPWNNICTFSQAGAEADFRCHHSYRILAIFANFYSHISNLYFDRNSVQETCLLCETI